MTTITDKLAQALRALLAVATYDDDADDNERAEFWAHHATAETVLAEYDAQRRLDPDPERAELIAAYENAEDGEQQRDALRDIAEYDAQRHGHAGVKQTGIPYAGIICPVHGKVDIDEAEYERQIARPDALWQCPCGETAKFDDARFEHLQGIDSDEPDDEGRCTDPAGHDWAHDEERDRVYCTYCGADGDG